MRHYALSVTVSVPAVLIFVTPPMLLLTTHLYCALLSAATVSPVRDPGFAEVLPDKSLKLPEPGSALCHWYVNDAPEPVDDAPLNVNVAAAVAAAVTVTVQQHRHHHQVMRQRL